MNCSKCQDLLAAFVEGLLDRVESARFETHLGDCSTCRAELEETRFLFDRMIADGRSAATISVEKPVMDRIMREQTVRIRTITTTRIVRVAVAAAVFMLVSAGIAYLTTVRVSAPVYADEVAAARRQIEQARTITWKQTLFARSKRDGTVIWRDVTTYRWYYKDPGHVRIETLQQDTQEVTSVEIWDQPNGKRLLYDSQTKKATLYVQDKPDVAGPVDWSPLGWAVAELSGNLQWLGTKQIGGRKANGFRTANVNTRFGDVSYNADFWVDAETKQLVVAQRPGEDKMSELMDYPNSLMPGMRDHDIVFGSELDDSLFRLDPPDGYALETIAPPEITEKEMLEWLEIAAKLNENTFPDSVVPTAVASEKLDRIINDKSPQDLSPLEKKIRDRFDLGDRVHFYPISRFVQHTTGNTWVYLGNGVRLGDRERIVCWYKPKHSTSYRVVYGDLTIKDRAAADLPLKVEP